MIGGGAGGSKSWTLLMAALQYVDHKDYHCIIFRRTYTDLSLPNGLLDISREWLTNTNAHWNDREKTWSFPSGATLTFGYLETEKDKYRYQGSEYTTIIFDELGQFEESQYLYLFSRLRKEKDNPLPLRMISASNPGSEWVKERFITNRKDRIFVPALYTDNPFLDHEGYEQSLDQLDYLTRQQLKYGDWDVVQNGELFKYEWIHTKEEEQKERLVRFWDLASSEGKGDYTAGVLLSFNKGSFQVVDVKNVQYSSLQVEHLVQDTYEQDRKLGSVSTYMEQEPGSSGKAIVEHYQRSVLPSMIGIRSTGSKVERARPLSALFEAGRISFIAAYWNDITTNQLLRFPNGTHDDIVDALSGAYGQLSSSKSYDLIFV